jgi:hypothetical protein
MGESPHDPAGVNEDARLVAPSLPALDERTAAALLGLLLRAISNEQRDLEGTEHDEAVRS